MDPRGDEPVHRYVEAAGLRLHVAESGEGPAIVLLHGFPDFWYGWRRQIPALAEAGFRVVAPDLPGYGRSDAPANRDGYTTGALADTVAALIDEVSDEPVVLVGHDWGGMLAWKVAIRRPDLLRKLVILNAPHPAVFRRLLRTPSQLLRSWYVLFFQIPWLPERVLGAGDFALLKRALRSESRNGSFDDEDLACYEEAWSRPEGLSPPLAYYRNAGRRRRRGRSTVPATHRRTATSSSVISVPTLVIWGERDPHLDVRNLDGLDEWVSDLAVRRLPDAGHWVQLDAHDRVNELIAGFGRP